MQAEKKRRCAVQNKWRQYVTEQIRESNGHTIPKQIQTHHIKGL